MKHVATRLLTALVLLGFLVAQPAFAQVPVGTVKGTVLDPEGGTLEGAKLTLAGPELMGDLERESEEGGRFIFQNLPAGIYSLKVKAPGYNSYSRDQIQVDIGRSVILPIFLTKPGDENIIEIVESGSPTIDTQKTSTSEVLSTDFLEELPQSRDYQSAIQALPGVTGGANPNVQGSASDENAILLDGVNITDPVTGTFSMNFNFDAMEQVEVMTGSYGAQYGQSMGGITNITTKSGGNDLEMKYSLQLSNSNLSTYYPAAYSSGGVQLLPSELDQIRSSQETSASVGGPIVKDRLWYFASYTHVRSDRTQLGVAVPRIYEGNYVFAKLTYQPTNKHRMTFSYFTNPTSIDNWRQSQFVPPQAEARQFQGGGMLKMDWNWYIAANTRLSVRGYSFDTFLNVSPVPCTHDPFNAGKKCESYEAEGTIDVRTIGTIGLGGAYSADNYTRYTYDDRLRRNLSFELNHYIPELMGEHQITAGVDYTQLRWDYLSGFIGNKINYDLINDVTGSPTDPNNVSEYYYYEFDGPLAFHSAGNQTSVFLTDRWQVLRNLTFNLGLRYDNVSFFNDVGDRITNTNLFSPRVGVAWDPFKDGTTRISVHAGRYIDSGRFAVSSFLNERGGGQKLLFGELFGDSAGSTAIYDSGQNTYLSAPNLAAPHADEYTLALEREIVYDIALGVQAVEKRFSYLWEDDEVNFIWNEDASELLGVRYAGSIQDIYRLRTSNQAFRRYQALQFTARQRFPDKKLQLIASYSLSRNIGNSPSNLTATLDIPQQDQFLNGYLPTDRRHVVTASASYRLPLDFVAGVVGSYRSGSPFNLLYWNDWYVAYNNLREPRGTHGRNPGYGSIDLRLTKDVDLREWGKLEASIDLFNLTNNRTIASLATGYYNSYGLVLPGSIQNPRSVQFGVRLEY